MPLFSSKLPAYSGEYDVGTIDIEASCDGRRLNEVKHRDSGAYPFKVDTVLFSLYYPAVKDVKTRRPLHKWVPKPLSLHAEGYARFAKINNFVTNKVFHFALWAMVGRTTIPAKVDIPIHGTARSYRGYDKDTSEQPFDAYGLPEFPVIIFSHGMASSRVSYTHYCAELASLGFIVAAIEHRDGSGPGTIVMDGTTQRKVFHFTPEQLDPTPEVGEYKAMQLAMRQAEVEETVRVLRLINEGKGFELFKSNPRNEGQDLGDWRGRLNLKRVIMAGHSFGATLAMQTLKGGPSESRPFIGAVVLDPGKQSGPLNDDISVPLLIINSESWSKGFTIFHGRPHFTTIKDIVEKVNTERKKFAWFITAKGTTHPSVTDAPLIEPFLLAWTTGSTIDAKEGVLQYVHITQDFATFLKDGTRKGVLREGVTHAEYEAPIKRKSREPPPELGIGTYWQIHAAPSNECPVIGLCGLE